MKVIVPCVNAHQLGTSTEESINNIVDKRTDSGDFQPFPSILTLTNGPKKSNHGCRDGFVNGLGNINIHSPRLTCQHLLLSARYAQIPETQIWLYSWADRPVTLQ